MLKTVEEVRDRLVKEWDPEGIILFGSRASGAASKNSDYDLLIVKDTLERPWRIAAERILSDRGIALDIFVYPFPAMRREVPERIDPGTRRKAGENT